MMRLANAKKQEDRPVGWSTFFVRLSKVSKTTAGSGRLCRNIGRVAVTERAYAVCAAPSWGINRLLLLPSGSRQAKPCGRGETNLADISLNGGSGARKVAGG